MGATTYASGDGRGPAEGVARPGLGRPEGEAMSETAVLQAFLKVQSAAREGLRSDGWRLYSGGQIIAEWGRDRLALVPRTGGATEQRRKDLLVELVLRQTQKDQLLRRLVLPG